MQNYKNKTHLNSEKNDKLYVPNNDIKVSRFLNDIAIILIIGQFKLLSCNKNFHILQVCNKLCEEFT